METLAYYTVELVRPPDGWRRLQELAVRARRATEQLAQEGVRVRFVRTVFVPEDDTCLQLYEAVSADEVRKTMRRAELPFGRVSAALSLPGEGDIETSAALTPADLTPAPMEASPASRGGPTLTEVEQ